MNIFKTIRLSIWSLVLAICVTIGGLYLAVSQTFLTTESLNEIVKTSNVAETVRTETLLPKILQTTKGSDYATLLDEKTVTTAFNSSISNEAINKKLEPAVDSLQQWLNSKQPSISFSIDMSDLSNTFADKLSSKVDEKVASLPVCTWRNTMAEAESGVCRSSLVTKEALAEKINEIVKRDASLESNATITPDSINISPSVQRAGSDLPTYLNMFYAASIVAAGIAAFVGLWLLFKHRLSGVIALGAGLIVSAAGLYIISVIGTQTAGTFSTDSQVLQIARAGSSALQNAVQFEVLVLFATGVALTLLGAIAKILLKRRSHPKQSLHLSDH